MLAELSQSQQKSNPLYIEATHTGLHLNLLLNKLKPRNNSFILSYVLFRRKQSYKLLIKWPQRFLELS